MKKMNPLDDTEMPPELARLNTMESKFIACRVMTIQIWSTKHKLKVATSQLTVIESDNSHFKQLKLPIRQENLGLIIKSKTNDGDVLYVEKVNHRNLHEGAI